MTELPATIAVTLDKPLKRGDDTITTHHNSYQITIAGGGDVRGQARELLAEIRRLQATERASSYQDD